MNEAWQNECLIAREDGLLGPPLGDYFRPPGLRTVFLSGDVVKRLETRDIFRRVKDNIIQHQAWALTVSRQFALDAFADLWLDAIADGPGITVGDVTTRQGRRDRPPVTFTLDLFGTALNGSRRLSGVTLQKLELVIQSGRIITEESEWIVCQNAELNPADIPTPVEQPTHAATAAFKASMYLAFGSGAWTPSNNKKETFSGQILLERQIDAVQFSEDGIAQRLATSGPFQMLGRATCAPSLGNLDTLTRSAAPCRILWKITPRPGQSLEFEIPAAIAKLAGGDIIADGFSEYPLDWMGCSDLSGTFITRRLDS